MSNVESTTRLKAERTVLYKTLKQDRQLQNICKNMNMITVDTYGNGKIIKIGPESDLAEEIESMESIILITEVI